MKIMIPWLCLAAITHNVLAQTGMDAYREGDFTAAAALFKQQTHFEPIEDYYLGRMYLYGYGVLKSNELAYQAFKRAAEKGLLRAQLLMGRIELIQHSNPEQALFWFKKAAVSDVSAQMYCAGAYLFGLGVKKNTDVARGYYISAAKAGNSIAQQTLAASFLETHQSANKKLALIWLEKSLAAQDPEAQVMMAALCRKGDLVPLNIERAKQLTEEAIAKAYVPAYYEMGNIELSQSHLKEAESWYLKAAKLAFSPAQITLSALYADPKTELFSAQNSFLWMLKAAESGSIEAQHNLAMMYQKGQVVEQNPTLAMEWEKKAQIAQQNPERDAAKKMAQWLTHGKATQLVNTDYRLPGIYSAWQNHTALQDNIYNSSPQMNKITRENLYPSQFVMIAPQEIPINQYYEAMVLSQEQLQKEAIVFPTYVLSTIAPNAETNNGLQAHREGYDYWTNNNESKDKNTDYSKFHQQMISQAILGDSTAQFDVAQMFQHGIGTNLSIPDAIKYYQMAAAQNDLPSEYQLGLLYLQGAEGLPPDYNLAMEWLTDAAFKGDYYAQYVLARLYEHGFEDSAGKTVIPENHEQSMAMYQLAAANHYGPGLYRLAEIMVREKPTDVSVSGMDMRRNIIKHLYQDAVNQGMEAAKLPLAFHYAMDDDQSKQAQAFADAQTAANAGSIEAAFLLGIMYDRGIATAVNHEQAIHWYEKSASNPVAAFILGTYAANGTGMDKNNEKASQYLQFSADKAFAAANYNLAVLKHQQNQDFLPYLNKAISLGSSRAGLELADYNMTHDNDLQKSKQAHELYERYAKQGDQNAQVKLGYLYEQGLDGTKDYSQALTWYTVAAEQGNAKAQYLLGRLYQLGFVGKEPDYTLAKQWYTLAQTRYPAAAVAYGFVDETVNDDYAHALNEYQQAVDLNDPLASYNLGLMYEMGKNQPINLDKAKECYTQAAQQGIVKAMVSLGALYLQEQKSQEALPWLNKAAALGDPDANYQLGLMNEKGIGKQVSVMDAVPYYQKAAEKNNTKALWALANLYKNGVGLDKDLKQASNYYMQLAQQNNADAQYQIALFCLSGDISGCEDQQAKVWLQKAQSNGCKKAERLLRLYAARSQNGVSYIEGMHGG